MQTSTLTLADALHQHYGEWEGLVEERRLNISHLPGWVERSARAQGLEDEVSVTCVSAPAGGLAAVAPWRLERRTLGGVPYRALLVGAGLVGYHPDWAAGPAGHELVRALWELTRELGVDALIWQAVPVGSRTDRLLARFRQDGLFWHREAPGETSPLIRFDGGWKSYLATLSKSHRKALKRKFKTLDGAGPWEVRWYPEQGTIEEFMERMLMVEQNSWKREAGIAVVPRSMEHRYYQLMLPWWEQMGAMRAAVLIVCGQPVAYGLRYAWKDGVGSVKTSYVQAAADLSPGFVTTALEVERACGDGFREYDFLGDRGQHKDGWATDFIAHRQWILFRKTPRAVAALAADRIARRLRRVPCTRSKANVPG